MRDAEAVPVTAWPCPKCGKVHELPSCDDAKALERFKELLQAPEEAAAEASRAEDEELQRYLGRTRPEPPTD